MSKTAEEILDTKPSMTEYPSYYSAHTVIEAMEEYAQAYHTAKLEEVAGSAEYWKAEHDAQVHKCNKFQMEISTLKAEIERLKGMTSRQYYDMYWAKQSEEENDK